MSFRCDRVCFVAHPDDDALWFGNTEILFGFDVKIILTYCDTDARAKECLEWSRAVNPKGSVIFLGHADNRRIVFDPEEMEISLSVQLRLHNCVNSNVRELYTHSKAGEYGHQQHIFVHEMAIKYFKPEKIITPHYSKNGDGAQFTLGGQKRQIMQTCYKSQFNGLMRHMPNYCTNDYLNLESVCS